MCLIALILIQLLLLFVYSESLTCNSFNNVLITAQERNKTPFNTTIYGCIERKSFVNKSVSSLMIRDQQIDVIGVDAVRHLVQLETFVILDCKSSIKDIKSGSFRNVPNLKNFKITNCGLTYIRNGIFDAMWTIQRIYIHDNVINAIEDEAFTNLPTLKIVDVNNNQLKIWSNKWFTITNSTALETLNFQFNKIETLPKWAFVNMKSLRKIYMDYNEISAIGEGAFKNLTKLQYLGLKYNRLKKISANVFSNNIKIKTLLIDVNFLNYLSNKLLKKLTVVEISLHNNPWNCRCLNTITAWVHKINGTIRSAYPCTGDNIPVCAFSATPSSTCSETVDDVVTKRFLDSLKTVKPPLQQFCARLD